MWGSVGCAGGGLRGRNLPVFLSRAPPPSSPPLPPLLLIVACVVPPIFSRIVFFLFHPVVASINGGLLRLASVDAARELGLILTLPSHFRGRGEPRYQLEVA